MATWSLLIRFTEPVHLLVSVNRFRACCVKGLAACGPLAAELPLGSCHGVAGWCHGVAGWVAATTRLVQAGRP